MSAEKTSSAPLTRIETNRGVLIVNRASGDLTGLWEVCAAELMTGAAVRELAGGVARDTLLRWRARDFPAPVLRFKAARGELELWSRTAIEAWLRERRARATD
jgi:hypothetical protein